MKPSEFTDKYSLSEKYRPRKLVDMVLPEEYRKFFEGCIQNKEIPHMLLVGIQGSGKTTVARILIEHILGDYEDCLVLNGSTSNGINVVRDQITEFLGSQGFGSAKQKIVFIDEFDYMSSAAQAGLRGTMEKYASHGRFLCTANYKNKISDALHSRFTTFEFKRLPKEFVVKYCKDVLDKEEVTYDDIFIEKLVSVYYPDIRKILNVLQSKIIDKNLPCDIANLSSSENKIHSFITDIVQGLKKYNSNLVGNGIKNVETCLRDFSVDFVSIYAQLFESDHIPLWAKIIINNYADNQMGAFIPNMHFMAMIYQIIKSGKEFYMLTNQGVHNVQN